MILLFYYIVVTTMALLLCSLITKYSGPYLEFLEDSSCFGLVSIPFYNCRTSLSCGKPILVVGHNSTITLSHREGIKTDLARVSHSLATVMGSRMDRCPQESQSDPLHEA